MKTYIVTFWRGNPQHKDGGYETTREMRAKNKESVLKRAKKEYKNLVYGTMEVLDAVEKEGKQ